ncbi:hypothetical protein DUNSADRAFT_9975 [Dunaliella salina]|uniref:Dynein attachment factor N-terminal domain-containing protein n=1 Tax=Dunaliella salina TaxID=3046 RepID=A0ABQ7GGC8_DUNSA|nr:hypothetical protein DUNSADRAFT_9975 [Dunaliella salina]|eukprot:KAF5833665.1 hypothetical protein DUNSADRAFT_9975 [Dunaliella salina]
MESRPPKSSKELSNAVYDDFKRKVIDAAKKRAVSQNVDYETFKNMVSVAHLKPLQAPSTVKREPTAPAWQFNADGSRPSTTSEEQAAAAARLLSPREAQGPPSTSGDFAREWRRSCPTLDSKYRYLQICSPPTLRSIFKVEVSSEVLKGIIEVLEACWQSHAGAAEEEEHGEGGALRQACFVVEVLESLAAAGRFGLAVKLMGPQGTKVLKSLFDQLSDALNAAGAVHSLSPRQLGVDSVAPDADNNEQEGGSWHECEQEGSEGASCPDTKIGKESSSSAAAAAELVSSVKDGFVRLRQLYGVAS